MVLLAAAMFVLVVDTSLMNVSISAVVEDLDTTASGVQSAIAAAVGPLIGGFVTTFLSWRVGFALEVVIIAVVLSRIRLVKDVEYTGCVRWTSSVRRCPWWVWALRPSRRRRERAGTARLPAEQLHAGPHRGGADQ